MKYPICADCKHSFFDVLGRRCAHPVLARKISPSPDYDTGRRHPDFIHYESCWAARNLGGPCGATGRLFEARAPLFKEGAEAIALHPALVVFGMALLAIAITAVVFTPW